MEDTRRRRSGGLRKLITAVFAVAFVVSIISTVTAFAAANLFKIQNAELSELSTTAEGSISSFDETNIVSNVTFHKLNDSAKYTITLKNTDTNDHVIESITDDNESPYISYIYDQHANEQINAGENLVFEVTAKYATAITDINQRAQATNVKFFIHFTDLEEEIPIVPNTGVNPNTGDYIHFSVLSLVISAAGLTIIGIIALKKHKKASKFIAASIIAVAAIATTATVKAATVEINSFTINASYALNDRLIVTYTNKNGDEQELIVNYGEPVNIPDQSKDGYTLTGWEDENGNPVDPTQPITEDIKIHPAYRAHTYTIKFNGNGATSGEMTDLAMTFGEAKTLPANAFTWAGHEYTGWDTEANGSGAHYGDAAEVTDLTTEDNVVVVLYAQWSVNPFHIDYDGNGATSGEMATTNCEYDQACQLRDNAFEKYGYDFAGWKYNDTIYADKADVTNIIDHGTITMQAQWTPHVYTITYTGLTSEEATTLRTAGNPDTYTIESPSFTLKNPEDRKDADGDTRERFVGWVEVIEPSTSVTLPMVGNLGNKTFNATWETVALPEYDITYDYDGGNVATANPAKLNKEQSATLSEPVKTGYTFTGWTGTTISGGTPVKPYTIPAPHQMGNLEYTAHYQAHTYTIAFDKNADDATGDTASMSMTYDEEKALTENGFARTGYTFTGWKLGDTEYTDGQTVKNLTAEDGATITLKAQWASIHYNIAFHQNADNVSGNMPSMTVAYDESTPLIENTFVLEHYKFMGWNTKADSTGTPYEDEVSVLNLTTEDGATIDLYAQWKERTAMLQTGPNVKSALSNLNNTATTFKRYDGASAPDLDSISDKVDIALPTSSFPVWAWSEGDNIYWWSEAEAPKFNPASNNFFNGLSFTSIDVSGLDASSATNMNGMFANLRLTNLDLSGFDSSAAKNMGSMFSGTTISSLDLSSLNTSSATTMGSMFYKAKIDSLKLYDETNPSESLFKTDNVTEMAGMFRESNIPSIDASKFNTAKVKNFSGMFMSASATTIDVSGWNTESATDFTNTFANVKITSLDLSHFNTKKVVSMLGMFDGTVKMENLNVSGWDNESLTTVGYMFRSCGSNVTNGATINLAGFTTSKVKSMNLMFSGSGFTSLNLGSFSSAELTDMSNMFSQMGKIQSLSFGPDFTAEHVTNMYYAFAQMGRSMVNLDLSSLNVSSVTNLNGTFASNNAVTIDLTGWDFSNVESANSTFYGANYIATIYASSDFPTSLGGTSFAYGQPIKGGAGTTYIGNENTYARIDDPDNGKPGYFTLKNARYVHYNGNGADNATPYGAMTSEYLKAGDSLKKNAFVRDGYVFTGWKDADNNEYTDEQVMADLAESKTPLELYAQWKVPVVDFIPAEELRLKMTSLATNDNNIKQFIPYLGTPDLDNISYEIVSTSESDFPIYMWYDSSSNTIYYWCEWKRPRMSGVLTNLFSTTSNIENVDFSAIDLSGVTSTAQLFSQKTKLKSVDFGNWDASNVTDMYRMFYYASSLETVDLSNFNTTNLQGSLEGMFDHCASLKSIDFGNTFKTDNVTNMHTMFQNNTLLEELDLSSFNTGNVKTMYYMFANDAALASIDFGNNFNTANVTNMGWMFFGCNSLNMLDLSTFSSDSLTIATAMFRFAPLQTIYATGSFNLDGIDETTAGGQMTFADTNLIGGTGTSFATTNHKGAAYGRIDDPDNGTPGYFTVKGARYIRYSKNGADSTETMTSHYLTNTGSLKTNTFTNTGKTFAGWNTKADGSGASYSDGQLMSDIVESKEPLTLYAQWN